MNISNLKIGDLIVRQKGPFSTHFMVYVGIQNGIPMVAENQNDVGVRFNSLKNALAGNVIKRFEKFWGTEAQRRLVIPRIKNLLGKSYDLIIFNCEHFARYIASGNAESKQVDNIAKIAIGSGSLLLIGSRNNAFKTIGAFLLVIGLINNKKHQSAVRWAKQKAPFLLKNGAFIMGTITLTSVVKTAWVNTENLSKKITYIINIQLFE